MKKRSEKFDEEDYRKFAIETNGLTGADIESIVRTAKQEFFLNKLPKKSCETKLKSEDVLKLIKKEELIGHKTVNVSELEKKFKDLGFKKSSEERLKH